VTVQGTRRQRAGAIAGDAECGVVRDYADVGALLLAPALPLDVPPRGRSFFRAPAVEGAASARLSVLNFEWVPRGGGM